MGRVSSWPLFLLIAVVDIGVLQAQPGQCPQILQGESSNCTVSSKCGELTCEFLTYDGKSGTATANVDPCTDPLEITVVVTVPGDEYAFETKFTSSGSSVKEDVTLNTSRNASYVDLQLVVDGSVAIPWVSLPLNLLECMCESMEKIISSVLTPGDTIATCNKDAECTGIECIIQLGSSDILVLETEFEICQEPPGIVVFLRTGDNITIFDHYFNSTGSEELVIPPDLHLNLFVSIVPGNYSMTVLAQIIIDSVVYDFFPEQQIIVDTSPCITEAPSLTDAPPPGQPVSAETCDALGGIANSPFLDKLGVACHVTCNASSCAELPCDGLSCNVLGYQMYLQVVPCEEQPSFFIQVNNSYGVVYENILKVGSTSVQLDDIGTLVFAVSKKPGAVSLKVSLVTNLFRGQPIIIVRQTDIPIDQCMCPNIQTCAPEEVTSLAPPTPGPHNAAACDAIKSLVQHTDVQCHNSTIGGCDSFVCNTYIGYNVFIQALPCRDPTAFRVMVNDTINSGTTQVTIFDDLLTGYTVVPLPDQGESLHILITNGDTYMGITILLNYSVPNARPLTVVPPTQISFDKCECPDVDCTSQSSTDSSTTQPSSSSTSSSNVLVILLPLVGVAAVVLLVGAAIVAWFIVRNRRKQAHGYAFQRMTFVHVEDKDEQDSDEEIGENSEEADKESKSPTQ